MDRTPHKHTALSLLRAAVIAAWPIVRQVLGWCCIIVGFPLFMLPIPVGLPIILVGVFLVGTRNWVMRWLRVHMRIGLRRWARASTPIIGDVGGWLFRRQQGFARSWRRYKRARAARRQERLHAEQQRAFKDAPK